MQIGGFDLIFKGAPIQLTSQYLLQSNLGCFNNRSVQLKQLAKVCAFRLRAKESQTMTTSGVVAPTNNTQPEPANSDVAGKDKDKPKRKVFMTTLPPKTGAIYKESYKDKLRKEKEEVERQEKLQVERQPTSVSSHTQASSQGGSVSSPNKASITPSLLTQASTQSSNSNTTKPNLQLAKKPNLLDARKAGPTGPQPTNPPSNQLTTSIPALSKQKQPLQLHAANISKTTGTSKPSFQPSIPSKPDQQGSGMQARPFMRPSNSSNANPARPSGANPSQGPSQKPKHAITLSMANAGRQSSLNAKDSDDDDDEGADEQTE